MEIEAKWETTKSTFHAMVDAFPDGGEKYGYELNVRWRGKPRRFYDEYYDTSAGELFEDLHMLRHRQRFESPDRISPKDSVEDLEDARWKFNWQRVQYKSTPTRLVATWFRDERGDKRLSADEVDETFECSGNGPHPAEDDPIELLLADHPGLDCRELDIVLQVVQFRYRVKFRNDRREPLYELSLDKIVTTTPGGQTHVSYGVELEVLRDMGLRADRVAELFSLASKLESEFGLRQATESKGRLFVPNTYIPSADYDNDGRTDFALYAQSGGCAGSWYI